MNNTKKLITLGGALIVVVAIIMVSETIRDRKSSPTARPFFPGFSEATCSAFTVADDKDTVKVFRKGDVWMVKRVAAGAAPEQAGSEGGAIPPADEAGTEQTAPETTAYPADSAAVHRALEKLEGMSRDILVSQNPEKQETFEVDSAHGVLVEVLGEKGESMGTFRIGKNAANYSSHYVRMLGSDDVWSTGGSIKYAFFGDLKRWRDKSILRFEPSSATALTVARTDTATGETVRLGLTKSADSLDKVEWSLVEPEKAPAREDVVEKMISALAKLNTNDWDASGAADTITGFDNPWIVASVSLENGDTERIVVGNKKGKNDNKYYVKADGREEVFLVYDSSLKELKKTFDDLKADEPKAEEDQTEDAQDS
ncbi:MAG: DUF4340 domain-containing protein [Chitinivibrionales bacterium]|nr:DUF4340 domain-containing protein [Chitinivibrionales bacterium]MBD3395211.1 DUF4340 domain-containing protein [Chitinivibrionales bacterium]